MYEQDGSVVTIDDYYNNIDSKLYEPRYFNRLMRFVTSFVSTSTDIVRTVGRAKGSNVVPLFKGGTLYIGPTFSSQFSGNTPLALGVIHTGESDDVAVKVRFKDNYLTYNKIGSFWAKQKLKNSSKTTNREFYIYMLDTQPAIYSNGSMEFANVDNDLYNFRTNNPMNSEEMLKHMASQIPGTDFESLRYSMYFDEHGDYTSESAAEQLSIISDAMKQIEADGMFHIVAEYGGDNGVYSNTIAKIANLKGVDVDTVALVLRRPINGAYTPNVAPEVAAAIEELVRAGKFIVTNPIDTHLINHIKAYRKIIAVENRAKSKSAVETPKTTSTGVIVDAKTDVMKKTPQEIVDQYAAYIRANNTDGSMTSMLDLIESGSTEDAIEAMRNVSDGKGGTRRSTDAEWVSLLNILFNC
jgi:hypothetical protein